MATYSEDKEEKRIGSVSHDAAGSDRDDLSLKNGDLLNMESVDPVLNAKMHMVNNAIDEIGFTPYHGKLFVLNGFG